MDYFFIASGNWGLKRSRLALNFNFAHLNRWAICLLGFLLLAPALLWRLAEYPTVGFDEGYRLSAARTLAVRGIYGTTTTRGDLPFDPGYSSGPVELLTHAALYRLFGPSIWAPRLSIALITMVCVGVACSLLRQLSDARTAILAILTVLAAPTLEGTSLIFLGRQILGEAPALLFILLGFWLLLRAWAGRQVPSAIGAGLAFGLAITSKGQYAIVLTPVLIMMAAALGWRRAQPWRVALATPITMLWFYVTWQSLSYALTPEAVRAENRVMLLDAVQTNLITPLFGRGLTTSAWVIAVIMFLSAIWPLRRFLRRWRRAQPRHWLEVTLALYVLATAGWFVFLSIGWPRYAFAGWVIALLLVGLWVYPVVRWLQMRLPQFMRPALNLNVLASFLAVAIFLAHLLPIAQFNQSLQLENTAHYIQTHIPREAVIETWEWELDAFTDHWNIHHPHQRYLFLAIRQFMHDRRPFDLQYDALQANPAYLIVGPMARWTGIYSAQQLSSEFIEIASFEGYVIYQRR